MASITFRVNGTSYTLDEWGETPLLWILQIKLGLFGDTIYCGNGQCGLCSVSVKGQETRACRTPFSAVQGKAPVLE